jgi:hypothetical protein
MIQINVISRISEDKNSFFDLIYALHKLTEQGITDVRILFIGDIISDTLYRCSIQLVNLFDLNGRVDFTKKSIRFENLPGDIKKGYFINFTIGNFMGYSGIESIKMGFKTIFYNPVKNLSHQTKTSASLAADLAALIVLIKKISTDQAAMDEKIIQDNLEMRQHFSLSPLDEAFLNSVLSPGRL